MSEFYCPKGEIKCERYDCCSVGCQLDHIIVNISDFELCPWPSMKQPVKITEDLLNVDAEMDKMYELGRIHQSKLDIKIIDDNFSSTEMRSKDMFINVLKNNAPKESK